MSIVRAFALPLTLGLACALSAQGFDAYDYFDGDFVADTQRAHAGVLTHTLTGDQPHWIEFSGSGEKQAAERFSLTDSGLDVRPNREHGTCEAVLDVGLASGTLRVEIVELARGGAFAWHFRDLSGESAWLVELKHMDKGNWQLRIRVLNGGRYSVVDASKRELAELVLPVTFTAYVARDSLTGVVGETTTQADATLDNGVGAGLAVTDETARLRTLSLDMRLHETWIADADVRLHARHALTRLREFATVGLLSGLGEYPHPGVSAALDAYSDAEIAARRKALDGDIYQRASALVALANAHPKLGASQHEAGIAALIAGDVGAGSVLLTNADKLQRTNVTSLALAEAHRRVGDLDAAEKTLREAAADLPEGLRPDYALIEGRLCADRGDIEGAEKALRKAARQFPDHQQVAAFADSAAVLYDPAMLPQSGVPGPLGLTLLTDLSPAQFVPVLEKLRPYIEKFRLWLPDLAESLTGRIAIFSGPVAYLRAALLVAGDNLDNVAGMYLSHGIKGGPTVMACRAFGEDELLRTLVHELWHLALASTGGERTVPRWLNEGMAVFLSAGRVQQGVMRYDTLPSEFEGFLDAPPGAEQLEAALTASSAGFYVPGRLRENYAAAWSVALLFATEPSGMTKLRDMLRGDAGTLAAVRNAEGIHGRVSQAVARILKD
ncbi:MAG: hypothetical protein K8I27_14655 [Planctomycetes bacterium]|nr:hypothetical protein [Planctomycetota bacterium]